VGGCKFLEFHRREQPAAVQRFSERLRCGITERLIVYRCPDAVGNLADDFGDIGFQILAFDFELCAHLFRGGREQFVEQVGRQVGAKCRPKSCSGRQGGWPFYCLRSPQYLCGPLSQQPDFMADWRSPQLVRQVNIDDRLRLFLHAAIQIFSSPLQRIGAEKAGAAESRASCRCPRDATRRPQLPGCVACPGGLRLIRTLRSSWPDLSGHPCL
jgi:hypothetical protein